MLTKWILLFIVLVYTESVSEARFFSSSAIAKKQSSDAAIYSKIIEFLETFQNKVDNNLLDQSDYETFLLIVDLLKKKFFKNTNEKPVYWYSRQG